MSIASKDIKDKVDKAIKEANSNARNKEGAFELMRSMYNPDHKRKTRVNEVVKKFSDGYIIQQRPRTEFNDMSWQDRSSIDQLMWNTYQPNDGDVPDDDPVNSWRSRAVRPITRNKVISIAASMLSKYLFPKVFSYSKTDEEQSDAAVVMSDLIEWVADQIDYPQLSLFAIIQALVNPVSIVYEGFEENYRVVRRPKEDDDGMFMKDDKGNFLFDEVYELDEEMSGFKACCVPNEEFFISDFYQREIQLQDWVIWRRVCNYDLARSRYSTKYEDFKFVTPGVQTIYVDANQGYYEIYDSDMQKNEVEEVYYWNRREDLFLIVVNGILLTQPDNPNPRNDKLYPFVSFFYEPFDEGRAFCGKSLVFKLAPDYRVINTLYPMIIDGTYLNIFPPTYATGSETIGSDVIVPGVTTTFSDPAAKLESIMVAQNLTAGMNAMFKVEESINQSSDSPVINNNHPKVGKQTAYEISVMKAQQTQTMILFLTMMSSFVKKFGRLVVGDVLQHMTVGEVSQIEGQNMVYKSFFMPEKMSGNEMKTRKIIFDADLPDDPIDADTMEDYSFKVLDMEGGEDSDMEIFRVNPSLFRNNKYVLKVTADTLNPLSEEAERQLMLEMFKEATQPNVSQTFDQVAMAKDFFLAAYDKSRRNPSKYIAKQAQGGAPGAPAGGTGSVSAIMGGQNDPSRPVAEMAE